MSTPGHNCNCTNIAFDSSGNLWVAEPVNNRIVKYPVDNLGMYGYYTIALGQYNLGAMYEKGEGVPQDYKEAVKWYQLAAEQGDADAQYNLGLMHSNGQGISQNDKEAIKWYRLAAEQGNALAQDELNLLLKKKSLWEKAKDFFWAE